MALVATTTAVALFAAGPQSQASAQVFGPPMTVFGSVTDSGENVPADLPIEAYVGNTVCGRGQTQYTGDGNGRVTVYFADVVSREQTPGCGADGVDVRIKVGNRFAPQTLRWRPGPAQMDITFGDATPAAIPTFTPTPRPGGSTRNHRRQHQSRPSPPPPQRPGRLCQLAHRRRLPLRPLPHSPLPTHQRPLPRRRFPAGLSPSAPEAHRVVTATARAGSRCGASSSSPWGHSSPSAALSALSSPVRAPTKKMWRRSSSPPPGPFRLW